MAWDWNSSPHPISDLRNWVNSDTLELRPDFQRKEVWSESAKIMLIDSILTNIPIPKIFVQALIKDDNTYRIVIDGQQRIKAILSFLRGEFALKEPYNGKYNGLCYDNLPKKIKEHFLLYKIDFNEILNADDSVCREIYNRINKYTVPLSKQELRRADYPGKFLDLAEELALLDFFEDSKIFTVASRRRMADVEYIAELLAALISGPQDKRDTLDSFFMSYAQMGEAECKRLRDEFIDIVNDIQLIFDPDHMLISKSRFRQKADFYSLFIAIAELKRDKLTLKDKDLCALREDLKLLNLYIVPNSIADILSEYAIKCVSQANTLQSRIWRKDFLKRFLLGTYSDNFIDDETVTLFHDILWDIYAGDGMCPPATVQCARCDMDISDYRHEEVVFVWKTAAKNHQLSNGQFMHIKCHDDPLLFVNNFEDYEKTINTDTTQLELL